MNIHVCSKKKTCCSPTQLTQYSTWSLTGNTCQRGWEMKCGRKGRTKEMGSERWGTTDRWVKRKGEQEGRGTCLQLRAGRKITAELHHPVTCSPSASCTATFSSLNHTQSHRILHQRSTERARYHCKNYLQCQYIFCKWQLERSSLVSRGIWSLLARDKSVVNAHYFINDAILLSMQLRVLRGNIHGCITVWKKTRIYTA